MLILTSAAQAYVFEDEDYEKTLELIDQTTQYALTGAMCVQFSFMSFILMEHIPYHYFDTASLPLVQPSLRQPTNSEMQQAMYTITKNARALLWDSSLSAERGGVGRMTRLEVLASIIGLLVREASRKTSWASRNSGTPVI